MGGTKKMIIDLNTGKEINENKAIDFNALVAKIRDKSAKIGAISLTGNILEIEEKSALTTLEKQNILVAAVE